MRRFMVMVLAVLWISVMAQAGLGEEVEVEFRISHSGTCNIARPYSLSFLDAKGGKIKVREKEQVIDIPIKTTTNRFSVTLPRDQAHTILISAGGIYPYSSRYSSQAPTSPLFCRVQHPVVDITCQWGFHEKTPALFNSVIEKGNLS